MAPPSSTQMWSGTREIQNEGSDYYKLDGFISYEEGDLTSYSRSNDLIYFIHLVWLQKLIIFYGKWIYNFRWPLLQRIVGLFCTFNIDKKETLALTLSVSEKVIFFFDAALDGESVLKDSETKERNDMTYLALDKGVYSVFKIEAEIIYQGEKLLIKGIQITL